jgi:DNA (cytosine-5)-methyltransferase 1
VDITQELTYLSLCTGYEGIGIGLKRIFPNLRTLAYVEREAYAIQNLVAKMEEEKISPAPIYTDVKTFPYRKFRGLVSIISAGFPCQPFSTAGVRKGTNDERHLYPSIADGISECQPRLVFLENVEGIISTRSGDTGNPVLFDVLRDLDKRGYECSWGVFSASEVGHPHQRKRVFILGYSKHYGPLTPEVS